METESGQRSGQMDDDVLEQISNAPEAQGTMRNPESTRSSELNHVLDLCLYRVTTERCEGRVLPYGIRQLIKEYARASFTNETLREAVRLWCTDRTLALQRYGDINDWDVHRVTDMTSLFEEQRSFNDRIDRWDVHNVTSMKKMFSIAEAFNQPLDAWDVRHVTNMFGMFNFAREFNQSLASWNVSRVTNMEAMFWLTYKFNQPLNTWDVSQVTTMKRMISSAQSFDQPLSLWNVRRVTTMCEMFEGASSFNQSLATWNRRTIDTSGMFVDADAYDPPGLPWWEMI